MKKCIINKLIILLSCVCCLLFTGFLMVHTNGTTVEADATSFVMNGGAAVRIDDSYETSGMRFTATISKATYDAWAGATYYMVIMPASYVDYAPIDSADSYVWDYSKVEQSSGTFVFGYDKTPISGKLRVLKSQNIPVPVDENGNVAVDAEEIVSYEIRSSVIDMKVQNSATKYVAECFAVKANGEKVFATLAGADGYRSILDVSIRARESGRFSQYDKLLENYETKYTTWYESEHGSAPTFSYKVVTYVGNTEKSSITVSGKGVHATVSETPDITKTLVDNKDTIYFNSSASTNSDTVKIENGVLTGYLCADSDMELHVVYNEKQHIEKSGVLTLEEAKGSVEIDTSVHNVYKVKVGTVTYVDGGSKTFAAGRVGVNEYTYYFDEIYDNVNHKLFTYIADDTHATYKRCAMQHTSYNTEYPLEIYGDTKYVTATVRSVTMIIDTLNELKNKFLQQAYAVKFYDSAKAANFANPDGGNFDFGYWQWGGYFELGADLDCSSTSSMSSSNQIGFYWGDKNAKGYGYLGLYASYDSSINSKSIMASNSGLPVGFIGTFDGKGHTISNYYTATEAAGMIGIVGNGGVVKNIVFDNVRRTKEGGILSYAICGGTIKNIYVSGVTLDWSSAAHVRQGVIVSKGYNITSSIEQCVVEVDDGSVTGSSASAFGVASSAICSHCYVAGTGSATANLNYYQLPADTSSAITNDKLMVLSTYADKFMTKKGKETFAFDSELWAQGGGYDLPYPKNHEEYKVNFMTYTCFAPDRGPIDLTTYSAYTGANSRAKLTVNENLQSDTVGYISAHDWYYAGSGTSYSALTAGTDFTVNATTNTVTYVASRFSSYAGQSKEIILGSTQGRSYVKHKTIIADLVVLTKEDVNNIRNVAKLKESAEYLWSGTFILGCDIRYGSGGYDYTDISTYGIYPSFLYYQQMAALRSAGKWPSAARDWRDTDYVGFKGTIDGHGFNIEGLALNVPNSATDPVEGGFIGILHKEGVIKNLSFTHGYCSSDTGYLTCTAGGTIQDVYIHVDYQGKGNKTNRTGILSSQTISFKSGSVTQYSGRINRVAIGVDHIGGANGHTTPLGIYEDHVATTHGQKLLENVVCWGNDNDRFNGTYPAYVDSGYYCTGVSTGSITSSTRSKLTRALLASDSTAVTLMNNCVSGNNKFWKLNSDGALTTVNLNGRDVATPAITLPSSLTMTEDRETSISYSTSGYTGSIVWSSDNEAVAVVSNDGNVFPRSAGTARITATSSNGTVSNVCTVTVKAKAPYVVDNAERHQVNVNAGSTVFASNGTTEYMVHSPNTAYPRAAYNIISEGVSKALGITINATAAYKTYNANAKYIVINDTSLFEQAGLTMPDVDLGDSGYYIKSSGNNVFIMVKNEKALTNAAVGFLQELLGYDVYAYKTYSFTVSEGDTVYMPIFDVVDRADFDYRLISNKHAGEVNRTMRFTRTDDAYLILGGIYQPWHNTLRILKPKDYRNEHPYWYNENWASSPSTDEDTKNNDEEKANQLCYTCRGDQTEWNAMVEEAYQKLKTAFISNRTINNATFSMMDNRVNCNCSACQASKAYYGSDSAAVIKVLNAISAKLDEYFCPLGRNVNIVLFAYNNYLDAPTQHLDEIHCSKNVGVFLAPLDAVYGVSFNDPANAKVHALVESWSELTDDLHMWVYVTNFGQYFYPFNTFESMTETYKFVYENDAQLIFPEGQYNQDAPTGFSRFKEYLESHLLWNLNEDYETLKQKFFANYFLDASTPMLTYFEELTAKLDKIYAGRESAVGTWYNNGAGQIHENMAQAKIWSYETLNRWLGYINDAYDCIAKYQSTDTVLYNRLKNHIDIEAIFIKYAICDLWASKYTETELTALRTDFVNFVYNVQQYIVQNEYGSSQGERTEEMNAPNFDFATKWGIDIPND